MIAVGTALSWSAVALVVLAVDPERASLPIFGVLYVSLWLAVSGTLSLLGFAARRALLRDSQPVSRQVGASFRQAVVLSLFLVVTLIIKERGLLTWTRIVILASLFTAVELFFISARRRRRLG
jgi:hypothetical protein